MKRIVPLLGLVLFLWIPTCFSAISPPLGSEAVADLRWPNHLEKGAYQVREVSTDKLLWGVTWETTVTKQKDQAWIRIHEKGHGQPWRYTQPVKWEKQMVLQIFPEVQFRSLQGNRWTQGGKFLSQQDLRVDPDRHLMLYQDTGAEGGAQESIQFPWNPKIFPDEVLFHWARTLAFHQPNAGECVLVVSPTQRFRMRATVRGTEEVTTPAGTFSCYQVSLAPFLGPLALTPIRALVPKMTLWCTVDFPHYWVRYKGPVGGPGSPQVIIELVSLSLG